MPLPVKKWSASFGQFRLISRPSKEVIDALVPAALVDSQVGTDEDRREIETRMRAVERDARRKRAYELRTVARLQYRRIAELIGYSVAQAQEDVEAFRRVQVPLVERHQARTESIEFTEMMIRDLMAMWATTEGSARLQIADRMLKCQAQLDSLHGLDRPELPPPDPEGLDTIESVDGQMSELEEEMAWMRKNGMLRPA